MNLFLHKGSQIVEARIVNNKGRIVVEYNGVVMGTIYICSYTKARELAAALITVADMAKEKARKARGRHAKL